MKLVSHILPFVFIISFLDISISQSLDDTTKFLELEELVIRDISNKNNISKLDPIHGTYIISGKKNELILLSNADVNLTDKTARQVFAKVPGVFVYDMDGAGNQINISTRGLDPHRGWEFNIRKDGVLTNSDMYAYPASHYSMPLESVDRIELIRGTGSLQYGAQFGGMLNYVSKQGRAKKSIEFESYTTIGSYNLISNFSSIGGKLGKFKYYLYALKKSKDGYRKSEHTDSDAESLSIEYAPSKNFKLKLDWSRSNYVYRIPGPLNDSMFAKDPQQSTRSRNYFNPDIHVPSIICHWRLSDFTKLQFTSSAVIGARNSVMFDRPATIRDSINSSTGQFNNRSVDVDHFRSYTNELRILQEYKLAKISGNIIGGTQYMNNNLHRTQQGKGTTGSDFDLTLVSPGWGRDVHLKTKNIAFFIENNLKLIKNLNFNIGARMESGESNMNGTIIYYPTDKIPLQIKHNFTLFGSSISYRILPTIEIYGGASQAYRPMIFKDLIPTDAYEKVDPNIKDSKGYNAEVGCRGKWKFLNWDVTGFALQYNNRFGTLLKEDSLGGFYTYRTNIGNSLTKGIELFLQAKWKFNNTFQLTVFSSSSLMDGRYTSGTVKSGSANFDIKNNKIESAPNIISRNGVTFHYRKLSLSTLFSYTAESYADALNTINPNPTGSLGIVPSYSLLDLNASVMLSSNIEFKFCINNLTNKQYFTKRPLFYPGPGIWPSDGINTNATIIVRI